MENSLRDRAVATRRLSVRAHLIAGFAVCIAAIAALVVTASVSAFSRERARTAAELTSVAQSVGQSEAEDDGLVEIVGQLARSPAVSSLEPALCETAFNAYRGVAGSAHAHVFDDRGTEICGLRPDGLDGLYPIGDWFAQVQVAPDAVALPVDLDPLTGKPARFAAAPVRAADGRVGVILSAFQTGAEPIDLPAGVPGDTTVVVTDADRRLVLGATANAPLQPGDAIRGTDFAGVTRGSPRTVDAYGERWIYTEAVIPGSGWHVHAGRTEQAALGAAHSAVRRMATIGVGALIVVALLWFVLQRRLARPVRRLGQVIEANWRGDDDADAPVGGPAEIARVASVFNDLMEERRTREADLRWRAMHDVLTGLPNRAAMTNLVTQLLVRTTREGAAGAVLFVDLDRFKLVNDSHGHAIGDQLLVQLAERLQAATAGGVLGRFGGDEFLVVCPEMSSDGEAVEVAARILESVTPPFQVDDHELYVSACVGIALTHPGESAEEAIRNADTAMYRAKERGTGRYALYDLAMREQTIQRLETERDLHRALANGQLHLHYQPVLDIATGRYDGVEALLRWTHPERGPISPVVFIPIAEECGLILPIGEWVLRTATAQAARWNAVGGRPFTVAVNVAAAQLTSGDLVGTVSAALRDAGLRPELLRIEVTESSVLHDPVLAIRTLERLRATGVKVSVDDFGTGYSSLSYLQQLPLDEVKIDRSFVARLDLDPTSTTIVRSIVELAHALGLQVVGEGVETPPQLERLRTIGCDGAQGFMLERPQPPERVTELLSPRAAAADRTPRRVEAGRRGAPRIP